MAMCVMGKNEQKERLDRLTPEMLMAGDEAYLRWDANNDEIEAMIADVFYSMIEAKVIQIQNE